MAILGKTGLYGAALYLATLFAIYGQKNVSFKDSKEVDLIQTLVLRKAKLDKAGVRGYREQRLSSVLKMDTKRYGDLLSGDKKTGKKVPFVTEYEKQEWLR